jgi:glycosyltransferase involved in cell wall biosynthesis
MTTARRTGGGRALLLTHILPDPHGVGLYRRAWRWVAELAAQNELEILVITTFPHPPARHPLPADVRFVHRTEPPIAPRDLADWFDPDASIAHILSGLSGPVPDRIVVYRFYMHDVAALLPPEWRAKAEIDCDDWEAATRFSLAVLAFRRRQYALAWSRLAEAVRYFRLERAAFSTYRMVHIAAFEDAARLRRLTGVRTITISPNKIVPTERTAPTAPAAGSKTLLFVGALFYPPNEDAMLWFGEAILPRLRRLVPDVRIVAAGRAEDSLKHRLALDGIDYVHSPDDLRPIYAQATAVIAPLRGGGGTKLKVLEAWLHERPVVATRHAARGLVAEPGRHLLVADTADDFARACAQVLADPELAARLVRDSHDLLRTHYLADEPKVDAKVGSWAPRRWNNRTCHWSRNGRSQTP